MPYDDGRNGARARSARLRASHEYEATQLESMRRRTREEGQPEQRVRLVARLVAAFRGRRLLNRGPARGSGFEPVLTLRLPVSGTVPDRDQSSIGATNDVKTVETDARGTP
jgi:hypothetical protein